MKTLATAIILLAVIASALSGAASAETADGPWFNTATGTCPSPTVTSQVDAGQPVIVMAGGLMSSSTFAYRVSPYGTPNSRPAWWYVDGTTHADNSGNICIVVWETLADDYGIFLVTVNGLAADQRQYNPASVGVTVVQPTTPTPTPTATPEPTPTPTTPPEPTTNEVFLPAVQNGVTNP